MSTPVYDRLVGAFKRDHGHGPGEGIPPEPRQQPRRNRKRASRKRTA